MEAMERDLATTGPARARIAAIDAARGVALGGMVVYHLIWDFAHFGLVAPTLPFAPATRALSHGVASAFLALAGVSLALAHPRWVAARRVSQAPRADRRRGGAGDRGELCDRSEEPILFGILHCIAVASLIAALFVAAPLWGGAGRRRARRRRAVRLSSAAFNPPALVWLGLGTVSPYTLDWRPLLPWAGVVADRARAGAGRGAAALRLALDGVAAGALARPRVRLRRPPQPRRSISSTSRSCSACCGAS